MYNTSAAASIPPPRSAHDMVFDEHNEKIILFGGNPDPRSALWFRNHYNDTWSYDLEKNQWIQLDPPISPSPRMGHSMIYHPESRKIYLFGGMDALGRLNDTWEYSYETDTWTELFPSQAPIRRDSHSMFYDSAQQRVILFGGYGPMSRLNDLWEYIIANNTWSIISTDYQPPGRYGHTMEYDSHNNIGLLHAGNNQEFVKQNDTWAFNCSSNSWIKLSPSGDPIPRYWHSMFYSTNHRQMVVFGGSINDPSSSTGSRPDNQTWVYDYNTNQWDKLTLTSIPSARFHSGFVFNTENNKGVLFGGINDGGTLNDLWILDFEDERISWSLVKKSDESSLLLPILSILVLSIVIIIVYRFRFKSNRHG
jgi:N-acetylneuraminic acid mutarotase